MKPLANLIRYRAGTVSDAPAVAAINIDTWRSSLKGVVPQTFLDGMRVEDRTRSFQKRFEQPHYGIVVAETDSHGIVGFCDFGSPRNISTPYDAELYALYVSRQFQRAGIGARLFVLAAEQLRSDGKSSLFLRVLEANPHANFYDKMGGKVLGRESGEIEGKKFDRLIYEWTDLRLIGKRK